MFYVYIIRNVKKETYIGYTTDLQKRLEHHNSEHKGYTNNDSWEYAYYEAYKDEKGRQDKRKTLQNSMDRQKGV